MPRARADAPPARRLPRNHPFRPALHARLEALAVRYGAPYLDTDPLAIPRRYDDPRDREVAALVAASLAFGNVSAIRASATRALEALGRSPAEGLRNLAAIRDRGAVRAPGLFTGPLHRWVRGADLERFLVAAGRLSREAGGLGPAFASGLAPGDPHVGPALARFVAALRERDPGPPAGRADAPATVGRGIATLFATPASGSACKRWNLFLRWMVRPDDGLDLGLWTEVPTRLLVLPLDVHVSRLVRSLRLTRRRTVDWKAAVLATRTLRRFDPDDPVRFDFALCRLGMLAERSRAGRRRRGPPGSDRVARPPRPC